MLLFLFTTFSSFAAYETYFKKVHPILEKHCYKCHSVGAEKIKGGLLLDSKKGWLKGGDSGEPAIVPRKPEKSLLMTSILYHDPDLEMPPKEKLSPKDIDILRNWIKKGALAPSKKDVKANLTAIKKDLWSLKPMKYVGTKIKKNDWVKNSIDKYVLAKIKEKKLQLAPDASPETLVRRVYYDLTGLPPTPEEIQKYSSLDEKKYKYLIKNLLKSPRFGEHWGRYWLDVVRYADTTGKDGDFPLPLAWRYRDYVIDSFNKDLPYNQFIKQQIAGDLMVKNVKRDGNYYAATGLLVIGMREVARGRNRLDEVDDQLDIIGKAFLGMSIGCARCHDHKFDPISIEDYYSLAGIFLSTDFLGQGVSQLLSIVGKDPKATENLMKLSDARFQVSFLQRRIRTQGSSDALKQRLSYYENIIKNADATKFKDVYSTVKDSFPHNTYVRIGGDDRNKGQTVVRNAPQSLYKKNISIKSKTSGRLEFANWIVSSKNPLTARVIVNRVWQYLMGKGIVNTSNNFGHAGDKPTHPKLLDYLARWFVKNGWSIKKLIVKNYEFTYLSAR